MFRNGKPMPATVTARRMPVTALPGLQSLLGVVDCPFVMMVVSIVFVMLLMTLTLASMQFSPRVPISFVRDRGVQTDAR